VVTISVCLGSACHLRGANAVLETFLALVEKYQTQAKVQMAGNFCQAHCTEGVVVQIDDKLVTHVTKDQVHQLFTQYVLNGTKQ
jgi:NADH:ubiquinone oxidoreductase subunit E